MWQQIVTSEHTAARILHFLQSHQAHRQLHHSSNRSRNKWGLQPQPRPQHTRRGFDSRRTTQNTSVHHLFPRAFSRQGRRGCYIIRDLQEPKVTSTSRSMSMSSASYPPQHRSSWEPGPRRDHRRGRQPHPRNNIYQSSSTPISLKRSAKSHGSARSQNSCQP
jgi:hypothetical protein